MGTHAALNRTKFVHVLTAPINWTLNTHAMLLFQCHSYNGPLPMPHYNLLIPLFQMPFYQRHPFNFPHQMPLLQFLSSNAIYLKFPRENPTWNLPLQMPFFQLDSSNPLFPIHRHLIFFCHSSSVLFSLSSPLFPSISKYFFLSQSYCFLSPLDDLFFFPHFYFFISLWSVENPLLSLLSLFSPFSPFSSFLSTCSRPLLVRFLLTAYYSPGTYKCWGLDLGVALNLAVLFYINL